jgi:antitoxin PrlF
MEIISMKVHVSAKGQMVIPASLRQKYGIKKGTKIIVLDNENSIILKPVNEQYFARLRGSLKGKGVLRTLLEERRKDKEKE